MVITIKLNHQGAFHIVKALGNDNNGVYVAIKDKVRSLKAKGALAWKGRKYEFTIY